MDTHEGVSNLEETLLVLANHIAEISQPVVSHCVINLV